MKKPAAITLALTVALAILVAFTTLAVAQNQSATKSLTLNVISNVSVTTTTLPSARIGQAYTATLAATGGTTPYTWSVTSGTLPPGLSLTPSSGVISGTPTAQCSANPCAITFQVTDNSGSVATIKLQWGASPTASVTGYTVLKGTASGGPYATTVATTGAAVLSASETVPRVSGQKYYYVVQAFAGTAKSVYSNEAIAAIP